MEPPSLKHQENNKFDVNLSESNRLLPSDAIPSSDVQQSPNDSYIVDRKQDEKGTPKDHGDDHKVSVIEIECPEDIGNPSFSWRKLWMFTGPGILMSIAFLDPGNLEGDLQAGAIAGCSLLWLLLWATVMGLMIQLLSARVGVATGKSLAELCREEYEPWTRYFLWSMAEIAVIAADIQEVIGTAIAIQILTHGYLPLWFSVVITGADCIVFLCFESYGVRKMEAAFAAMVATMAVSFAYMFADAKPSGKELLLGLLVPKLSSKTIRQAVGVFGCVISPYNIYLHSALVQSRKVDTTKTKQVQEAIKYYSIESSIALLVSFMINLFVTTVFAQGFYGTANARKVGLQNAGHYLEEKYGGGVFPILYMWGIGLLAAGQSSTITGTYAGQFIMGGFLNLQLKEWLRALITRSFAIVPTMILVIVFDTKGSGMDMMNEALNVVQSMQVPFALIPLFTIASKEQFMGVFKIGPTFEKLAWITVALVAVINGYVLYDFYVNAISRFTSRLIFCTISAVYMVFIIYLSSRGGAFAGNWLHTSLFGGYSHVGREKVTRHSDIEEPESQDR